MKKARILYVIGTLDVGGAERQMAELASRLDRKRFAVSVCALTSGGPVEKTLEAAGISVTIIGIRGLYKNFSAASLLRIPAALWRLRRFIRRGRFDIVHGILFHAYVLAALMGRLRRRESPLPRPAPSSSPAGAAWTSKSNPKPTTAGQRGRPIAAPISSSPTRRRSNGPRSRPRAWPRTESSSSPTASTSAPSTPWPDSRTPRPCAPRWGLPAPPPSSAWWPTSINIRTTTRSSAAAALIARDFPAARFLLVGTGPTRAGFEARLAADPGLAARFVILGSRRDIPALLGALDIFVLSSREEGFPNAVLEAMAAAKPVVAAAVGGVPEAVRDGATGLLVPPGDAAALAAAVSRLAADPGLARAMGAAGRAAVEREFGMGRMIAAYESLYEGLLARSPRKARFARAPSSVE